jgi:hypothetical protein
MTERCDTATDQERLVAMLAHLGDTCRVGGSVVWLDEQCGLARSIEIHDRDQLGDTE